MTGWIKVDGAEALPVGEWLVVMADGKKGYCAVFQAKKETIAIINGHFYFDYENIVAYHEIPNYEEETDK